MDARHSAREARPERPRGHGGVRRRASRERTLAGLRARAPVAPASVGPPYWIVGPHSACSVSRAPEGGQPPHDRRDGGRLAHDRAACAPGEGFLQSEGERLERLCRGRCLPCERIQPQAGWRNPKSARRLPAAIRCSGSVRPRRASRRARTSTTAGESSWRAADRPVGNPPAYYRARRTTAGHPTLRPVRAGMLPMNPRGVSPRLPRRRSRTPLSAPRS